MSIPTQHEFAEWLALVREPLAVSMPDPSEPISKALWVSTYKQSELLFEARSREMSGTAVGRWMVETKELRRARDIVFRKLRAKDPVPESITPEESADRWFALAKDRPAMYVREEQYILAHMSMFQRGPQSGSWTEQCIAAIAEYFDPKAPKRIVQGQSELRGSLQKAREAIAALNVAIENVQALQLPDARLRTRRTATRFLKEFQEGSGELELGHDAFPISRVDNRSSERLFVFRMHRANVSIARGPRIEAISELMSIDGFRHQYDHRTIERLCADFTGRRAALKALRTPG